MPIYQDLSNLVLAKSTIELKYAGGVAQFKKDFRFDAVAKNREDNELIGFAYMNSSDISIDEILDAGFHAVFNGEVFVSSNDFVIINRYGGREWECPWLADNGVFFWHTEAPAAAQQEAKERGECPVNQIEETYGSFQNWAKTIYK